MSRYIWIGHVLRAIPMYAFAVVRGETFHYAAGAEASSEEEAKDDEEERPQVDGSDAGGGEAIVGEGGDAAGSPGV